MYKLTLKSDFGDIVFGGQLYTPYTITEIEGIASPEATINLSDLALLDGQKYNSAKANTRTINLAFAIEYGAEANRLNVYRVLRVKKPVRMIYKSELMNVFIDGYIQNIEISHFDIKQVVTVTIICPSPYFKAVNAAVYDLSQNVKMFHFPFSITADDPVPLGTFRSMPIVTVENVGQADTGLIFDCTFTGSVSNLTITDYDSGEFFKVNDDFAADHHLIINTNKGEKSVFLEWAGNRLNEFHNIEPGSTWFDISGTRTFTFSVDSGNVSDVSIAINLYSLYEGV